METKTIALAGGALVILFLLLSASKGSSGSATLAPISTAGTADDSQSFLARVGLVSSLANIAGTLDQSAMQLDAAKSHDRTQLNLAQIQSDYGTAKLQNDYNIATKAFDTQIAINDRNARTQDKQSNNSFWGSLVGTVASVAAFFI